MTDALVSVVIPTHDRAVLVVQAIESARRQTHENVEIIVIDDGSTDDTSAKLSTRYRDVGEVQILEMERRGPAAARNAGLERASGTHIAFLDSDDEWNEWKLEYQLECLRRLPDVGMVWSDTAATDTDGVEIADRYLHVLYTRFSEIHVPDLLETRPVPLPNGSPSDVYFGDLYPTMIHGNLVHTSTVLMTRERLEQTGSFDESLTETGEDFDFHLRSARSGPIAFADVATTRSRVGAPDQLTRPDLMIPMARNHLATILTARASDDGRIPTREWESALGGAHAWLGEELLEAGDRREARGHLRSGIGAGRRIRTLALLVIAMLPSSVGRMVRRALGSIVRTFRRRSAG